MLNSDTKFIAKCHFADCLGGSVSLHRISGNNLPCFHIFIELVISVHHLAVYRKIILILLYCEKYNLASGFLKLG